MSSFGKSRRNTAIAIAAVAIFSGENGNHKKALELQLAAIELIDALFCEVNPMPVKTAMNLMGKNVGGLRPPMCEMDEKNIAFLRKALTNYGLL